MENQPPVAAVPAPQPSASVSVGEMAVVVLSFSDRFRRIRAVLVLMLLVGLINGVPSGYVPQLQQDAFGNNQFVITGLISAGKGLICAFYNAVMTGMSDRRGRKGALVISMGLAVLPYSVFVASNNFWAYSLVDMFCGMYAAALCLSLAVIADRIPRACGMRTECFALVVAMFFLGLGIGPFAGFVLTQNQTFMIALCMQLGTLIYVIVCFPNDSVASNSTAADAGGLAQPINTTGEDSGDAATGAVVKKPAGAGADETTRLVCPYREHRAVPDDGVEQPADEDAAAVATAEAAADGGEPALEGDGLRLRAALLARRLAIARLVHVLLQTPQLALLSVAIFSNFLAVQVIEAFLFLYLQNSLNFSPNQQMIIISAISGSGLISLFFVAGFMKRRLGLMIALRVALAANFLQVVLFAFIQTPLEGYLLTILGIVALATYPCASALATTLVPEEAVGASLGIASAARMFAEGASPLGFGVLFNATQNDSFPGSPFLVAGGCVVAAFILTFFVKGGRHERESKPAHAQ